MGNEDFIKCIDILRKQPYFFKGEDIKQKLKCLEIIKKYGNPQITWVLFGLLKNNNPFLRDGAAKTIISLFEKTESQNILYSNLKYTDIKSKDFEYFKTNFSSEIYLHLVFVASLNQSGYVREKAIKELLLIQNPKAIRFIIFRLADWVTEVRETAKNALRSYFQPDFIDEFLSQVPLIEWLLKVERTNLNDVYDEIYRFIFRFGLSESFYDKIKRFGDKTKFIYIRNYLKFNAPNKEVFEMLSNDRLFLVKIELLKHIEKLDEETQKYFIEKFLHDRSAKVRVYAIYSTKPFRTEFREKILESIFDVSASVRELARFILRDSNINFAELYRQRLKDDENSLGAILGLTEVGTLADLPIFETYVCQLNAKIKVACLTAINSLNKEIAKKYALKLLSDSSANVRNKSIEILSKLGDEEVFRIARDIYQKGSDEQKRSILKLFGKIGGWKVVGDFIFALGDSNEKIQDLGWMNLEKWRRKQLFSRPSAEDVERTKSLYEEFDKTKPELNYHREKLWTELPFYLK
jgi:HEAT repeat protein